MQGGAQGGVQGGVQGGAQGGAQHGGWHHLAPLALWPPALCPPALCPLCQVPGGKGLCGAVALQGIVALIPVPCPHAPMPLCPYAPMPPCPHAHVPPCPRWLGYPPGLSVWSQLIAPLSLHILLISDMA